MDTDKHRVDAAKAPVDAEDDASESTVSSYASPKDHISVSSGASDQQQLLAALIGDDAPTLSRLERTETEEQRILKAQETEVDKDNDNSTYSHPSSTSEEEPRIITSFSSENAGIVATGLERNGIQWGEDLESVDNGIGTDEIEAPDLEDELTYEHRPMESTPTRRSLSQAARELTKDGVTKADKKLARCLSGLTAEVLGDEGRANSPLDDERWRKQEKHFFILSSAGKPIYSRYGDESALCGMMAILEAIHSVVQSKGEEAVSIMDGPVKIVFLSKGPVVLVGVSRRKEAVAWITKQLDYLFHHVLCLATGALLKVLNQNPGQDIRNLLKGSAPITEGLIVDYGNNPGLFLESFFPVRMLEGIRRNAANALIEAARVCQARASFLLFDGQVVCMHQDSPCQMKIMDLLLLLNFVLSNKLYRSQSAAEFNAPICMPHLHETAFLHAYIYFIDKDPDLVVILLMTQPDTFHLASDARKKMEKKLRDVGVIHSLRSRKTGAKIYEKGQILIDELPLAAGGGQRELSAVQTFLFSRRSSICPQYALCQPSSSTYTEAHWKLIVEKLASLHSEHSTGVKADKQKIHWHMDGSHSILYESTIDWEMYLVCDPLTMKEHATSIQKQIVRFLMSEQVKEELFIWTNEK